MKQLIGQEEADKRIEESSKKKIKKQVAKKHDSTIKKAGQLKEEMLALRYHKLLDNKQIAAQVDKDERTVNKQIGVTPKFVLVGRMSREEAVYYHEHWGHKSNAQITEIMGISVNSVHNAKRKYRSMEECAGV